MNPETSRPPEQEYSPTELLIADRVRDIERSVPTVQQLHDFIEPQRHNFNHLDDGNYELVGTTKGTQPVRAEVGDRFMQVSDPAYWVVDSPIERDYLDTLATLPDDQNMGALGKRVRSYLFKRGIGFVSVEMARDYAAKRLSLSEELRSQGYGDQSEPDLPEGEPVPNELAPTQVSIDTRHLERKRGKKRRNGGTADLSATSTTTRPDNQQSQTEDITAPEPAPELAPQPIEPPETAPRPEPESAPTPPADTETTQPPETTRPEPTPEFTPERAELDKKIALLEQVYKDRYAKQAGKNMQDDGFIASLRLLEKQIDGFRQERAALDSVETNSDAFKSDTEAHKTRMEADVAVAAHYEKVEDAKAAAPHRFDPLSTRLGRAREAQRDAETGRIKKAWSSTVLASAALVGVRPPEAPDPYLYEFTRLTEEAFAEAQRRAKEAEDDEEPLAA